MSNSKFYFVDPIWDYFLLAGFGAALGLRVLVPVLRALGLFGGF